MCCVILFLYYVLNKNTEKCLTSTLLVTSTYSKIKLLYDSKTNNVSVTGNLVLKLLHRIYQLTIAINKLLPDYRKIPGNQTSSPPDNIEPEFLTFDEVLDNIAFENKNYSRRKPPLDMHSEMPVDFMYDDNVVDETDLPITKDPVTEIPIDGTTVVESLIESYTEVVIDLLESANEGVKLDDLILKGQYCH